MRVIMAINESMAMFTTRDSTLNDNYESVEKMFTEE